MKKKLAYDELTNAAKFREQLRLTFAGVIVATAFIVPTPDAVMVFLRLTLMFSASLAALFLILSAARIKYSDAGRIYETFHVSERFRMRMFDWSMDFFGFAAIIFVALLLTGLIEMLFSIKFDSPWNWIVVGVFACVVGAVIILVNRFALARKTDKKLSEI